MESSVEVRWDLVDQSSIRSVAREILSCSPLASESPELPASPTTMDCRSLMSSPIPKRARRYKDHCRERLGQQWFSVGYFARKGEP